jgi:hemoglobin
VDIQTSPEVRILVDRFYEKVRRDPLIGPIFDDVAKVDWPSHLATLCTFWETLLKIPSSVGATHLPLVSDAPGQGPDAGKKAGTCSGAPFPKHAVLPVEKAHFDRWLQLFIETVDENFVGPKADEAKGRALSIADTSPAEWVCSRRARFF